jgi:hypothetical protein
MLPTPPDPLDYASESSGPRRPVIDLSLAFSCLFAAIAVTGVLFLVVPRAEEMFKSFDSKLPLTTVALLAFSRFCRGGGIVLVWGLFIALPFLAPLARRWPPPDSRRRYFRPSRLILTLFLTIFFGWIILSLFLPYIALIDAVSNPTRK